MPGTKKLPAPPVPPPLQVDISAVLARLEQNGRLQDAALLERVHAFSAEMHRDQLRRSGEPYLTHPLAVAWILADLRFDQTCVAVGLLHDVLEDTLSTREALDREFGPEIGELVDGVTKIGRHLYVRRDEAQAETFRKMVLASAKDIRVIVVKLADRLHNMLTLAPMSAEARRRISQETLEIYAPLANRLGMAKVKGDLEDLAFYYLYPLQFAALEIKLKEKLKMSRDVVESLGEKLRASLAESGIEADINYRVKRYYSIYQKLRRQEIDISELYDYLAFRVITTNLKDTYAALGVVHQNWRPIPGRFKDYIAMAKPNLYQSLHTTVLGAKGQPFEVQIRTREMDLIAEEGIAAHWRYKEGKSAPEAPDRNILWLRQLLEWQQEVQEPRAFLDALKIDLYPDEVYVFTPKGEVLAFPRDATPLDFAYRIHTDLGHRCVGARVNGRLVPLKTGLRTGDIVEILTNPTRQPSRDWLQLVATSRAKSKIRHWLNTEQTRQATLMGQRMLEKELKRYRRNPKRVYESDELGQLLTAEGIGKLDDLFARVGYGRTTVRQVLARLLPAEVLGAEPEQPGTLRRVIDRLLPGATPSGPIVVSGSSDLLAVPARCCKPLPGEEIVGYVTRGRGVSVHSVDCPNVRNLFYNAERRIDVAWGKLAEAKYPVTLRLETEDETGMLARVTEAIAKLDSNIREIEADTDHPGRGSIELVVDVKDRSHLERVRVALRSLPGVLQVDRKMAGRRGKESASID